MANPFLFNDNDLSPKADLASNPFLMQESQDLGDDGDFGGDNPFLAQANNPFAAFGEDDSAVVAADAASTDECSFYPPPPPIDENNTMLINQQPPSVAQVPSTTAQSEIDSVMSFFGTTISDDNDEASTGTAPIKPIALNIHKETLMSTYDDQMAYSSEDELNRDHQKEPPPRPVLPPSRTTQDLILSVADQLDQTSSHLLGRIPATRTPSPVSMRDLHSPSPTPDLCDLLDVSDEPVADFMNTNENHQFMSNDNPFMMTPAEPVMPPIKMEPPRPPPPSKPTPPRPTPPRRPSPPQVDATVASSALPQKQPPPPRPAAIQQQQQPEPDLFDMFGSEDVLPAQKSPQKPPLPKSNQDILNLFAAPAVATTTVAHHPPAKQDFDILSMDHDPGMDELPTLMTSGNTTSMHPPPIPQPPQQPLCMQHINQNDALQLPPPSIELEESPTPEWSDDNEDEQHMDEGSSAVISPAASDDPMIDVVAPPLSTTTSPPHTEKENILDEIESTSADHSVVEFTGGFGESVLPPTVTSDFSDEHANMDYAITPMPSVNPFASPESDAAPVMVDEPALVMVQPIMVAAPVQIFPPKKASPPPPPQRGVRTDEFDAFAAKFDSVKKEEHSLLDGFGGVPSRSVSAEFGKSYLFSSISLYILRFILFLIKTNACLAWGDGDETKTIGATAIDKNSDGFGNDEGFDSFLAMGPPEPPQVYIYIKLTIYSYLKIKTTTFSASPC